MIGSKYMILLGFIVVGIVLYYYYDEITKMKKMILPTYQKNILLESKVSELEKKIGSAELSKSVGKKSPEKKLEESAPMSLTYHSDFVNKDNHTYSDFTDGEIENLKKNPVAPLSSSEMDLNDFENSIIKNKHKHTKSPSTKESDKNKREKSPQKQGSTNTEDTISSISSSEMKSSSRSPYVKKTSRTNSDKSMSSDKRIHSDKRVGTFEGIYDNLVSESNGQNLEHAQNPKVKFDDYDLLDELSPDAVENFEASVGMFDLGLATKISDTVI